MPEARLDVRLDRNERRKLEAIAAARGQILSAVVRDLIEQAYQDVLRDQRMRGVQQIVTANIEAVPPPETLSQQLDETYALPDLS